MIDLNGAEEETAAAPGVSWLAQSVAGAYTAGSGLGQTRDQVPALQSEPFPSLSGGYDNSDHLRGLGVRIKVGNAREPAAQRVPHGGRLGHGGRVGCAVFCSHAPGVCMCLTSAYLSASGFCPLAFASGVPTETPL